METSIQKNRLGILVGGGPAPGINSAISACAIEAINSGLNVIGIYDDQVELFSLFHRVRRPENDGVGGTGLGLYIVKRLANWR